MPTTRASQFLFHLAKGRCCKKAIDGVHTEPSVRKERERERESIGLCCRVYVNWLAKVIMTTRDLISLEN